MVKKFSKEFLLKILLTASFTERVQHESKTGIWFKSESSLPEFSIEDIYSGLESNSSILVRTQTINSNGEKTVLSRAESLDQIKRNGKQYVKRS